MESKRFFLWLNLLAWEMSLLKAPGKMFKNCKAFIIKSWVFSICRKVIKPGGLPFVKQKTWLLCCFSLGENLSQQTSKKCNKQKKSLH